MKVSLILEKGVAVLVIVIVVLMVACSQPMESEMPAESETSTETMISEGQALVEERCTKCHDLARVEMQNLTLDEWTMSVERMVQKGATLSVEEQTVVIEYLVETYGPAVE